ncbi:ArsR/SmtB family transcription factor [Deinococcus peraridilitoris]|uniref:Rhodanese-related sulfurtransferase n=1 Tax=Deinococcus peraridilitoris (strain DSM 19664 / LMG 22246 / CIP 109416 / KR-200) TaxID=937777 RepID=L0A8G3_DEIPD|nr:metalloregulator ArsR/SmtB family transcription factor [Deinococcus peraridilitoris]AFZ69714.1 Rhodanese-related sulfurtransferase [Deinococcus peraridilitoris DSM 19664]
MSDHRPFKRDLYEQFAQVGKALASPARLELLDLLAQSERTVEELAREAGLSVANASQHLQVLRQARLVDVRREGTFAHYRLAGREAFQVWQSLRNFGDARVAEIRQVVRTYLSQRDTLEAVTIDELRERLDDVVILDVRPETEFQAGHIPGARSVPVEQLEDVLPELPREGVIVAYCRGPYCVYSDEAVNLLRQRGFDARRLDVGLPDWRAAGLPVEVN